MVVTLGEMELARRGTPRVVRVIALFSTGGLAAMFLTVGLTHLMHPYIVLILGLGAVFLLGIAPCIFCAQRFGWVHLRAQPNHYLLAAIIVAASEIPSICAAALPEFVLETVRISLYRSHIVLMEFETYESLRSAIDGFFMLSVAGAFLYIALWVLIRQWNRQIAWLLAFANAVIVLVGLFLSSLSSRMGQGGFGAIMLGAICVPYGAICGYALARPPNGPAGGLSPAHEITR